MIRHFRTTAFGFALLAGSLPAVALGQVTEATALCDPGSTVIGVVADMLSRRPLGGATVTLRSPAPFVPQIEAQTTARADGQFLFCIDALGDGWDVLAQFYTVESRAVAVTGEGEVDTLFVSWSAPATLSGTVRSQGSGAPVEGARVSIEDRRVRALTNESGEFSIRGLGAGPLVVSVSSIGFATRVDTVLAASGAHIALEISIGEQAIELDPLVVTARAPPVRREREMRNLGMSALGMNQAEINEALPRAIDFVSLLRWANIPGLLISQGSGVGSIGTCIQFHRGTTATNIDTPNCSMLAVYVNGVRMPNGSVLVESLDPTIVEEFIVLRPAFAQFQYMGPLTANGVLDIILR